MISCTATLLADWIIARTLDPCLHLGVDLLVTEVMARFRCSITLMSYINNYVSGRSSKSSVCV